LGDDQSPNDTFIQLAGSGHLLPVEALRSAMEKSSTLRATLLRYVHAMTVQIAFTALANSKVKVDARLARWLLMAHDRVDGDRVGGKWLAFAHAVTHVLQQSRRLLVELASSHGTHQSYDTPFVFVGNNRYAVAGLEIGTRTTLDGGKLRVCTWRPFVVMRLRYQGSGPIKAAIDHALG
jgi:hypothetical protein